MLPSDNLSKLPQQLLALLCAEVVRLWHHNLLKLLMFGHLWLGLGSLMDIHRCSLVVDQTKEALKPWLRCRYQLASVLSYVRLRAILRHRGSLYELAHRLDSICCAGSVLAHRCVAILSRVAAYLLIVCGWLGFGGHHLAVQAAAVSSPFGNALTIHQQRTFELMCTRCLLWSVGEFVL